MGQSRLSRKEVLEGVEGLRAKDFKGAASAVARTTIPAGLVRPEKTL